MLWIWMWLRNRDKTPNFLPDTKPWWKKPKTWVIIVVSFVVLSAIGAAEDNNSGKTTDSWEVAWDVQTSKSKQDWCDSFRGLSDSQMQTIAEHYNIDWSHFRPILQEHC